MPIKVLAVIEVNQSRLDALAKYMEITDPLLARVGAKVLNRFSLGESVVGEQIGENVVIVEYPNEQALREVFNGPEYAAATEHRDKAFLTYKVSLIN